MIPRTRALNITEQRDAFLDELSNGHLQSCQQDRPTAQRIASKGKERELAGVNSAVSDFLVDAPCCSFCCGCHLFLESPSSLWCLSSSSTLPAGLALLPFPCGQLDCWLLAIGPSLRPAHLLSSQACYSAAVWRDRLFWLVTFPLSESP